MSARTIPEDGDVVIRHGNWDGRDAYLLHTAPGADQYLVRTYQEAVAQAVSFAQRHGVRAWLTNGGAGFSLLEDFRRAEVVAMGIDARRRD